MVGIVIVSHSATLAAGVAELAREMGGADVAIEVAGGLDEPGRPLGTDAALVVEAIARAGSGDGVLVLMDLGSAVLSAEMAVDMLEGSEPVSLSAAPVVEGAVAAAAAARQGASLEEVAAEAERGADMKAGHLGAEAPAAARPEPEEGDGATVRFTIDNPLGLHARPAARFVQTAARFDAELWVTNATTGRGPAAARSLSGIATLGARSGHEVVVTGRGPRAAEALAALRALAAEGFGDDAAVGADPVSDAGGAARPEAEARPTERAPDGALRGVAACPGVALGPVRRLDRLEAAVTQEPAGPPESEWARLEAALGAVRAELDDARAALADQGAGGIIEAQQLLLDDDALVGPARADVGRGRAAAQAWTAAAGAAADRYRALEDPYQRARAGDVEDLARRVVARLAGRTSQVAEPGAIVVADDLGPADVVALEAARVAGIATARGGPTSHSAILARAAGIPTVVGCGRDLLEAADGTRAAVDGDAGLAYLDPSEAVAASLQRRREAAERRARAARAAARRPGATRDGERIEVAANVGSAREAAGVVAAGAEGVGLLRTEFLFLDRAEPPDEDEQAAAYGDVARALEGRPVVVRTLDAGADKPLAYLPARREANPFLGVRGLRLGLAEPDLLATQLRAVLRTAADHPVKVMFPMVATTEEVRGARAVLDAAADALGGRASGLEVGVMIEVPAAALLADRLAPEVDFFSIGTNDLTQYVMAAERGNSGVAALGDALHPAVLALVRAVCDAAAARSIPVSVCGEAAGDAAAAALFVGLGVRKLSMAAPAIAGVKQSLGALSLDESRRLADDALGCSEVAQVRALAAAALERGLERDPG